MRISRAGRQGRSEGGRSRVIYVRVTEEQDVAIRSAAAAQGVSPQTYLLERAGAGSLMEGWTAQQRRAVAQEVLAIRRVLAGIGTNVNQIAAATNATGEVNDSEVRSAMTALEHRLPRLDAVARELGGAQ